MQYIIGQHGSNYGTERFKHPKLEEELPDKFISWGNIKYQKYNSRICLHLSSS